MIGMIATANRDPHRPVRGNPRVFAKTCPRSRTRCVLTLLDCLDEIKASDDSLGQAMHAGQDALREEMQVGLFWSSRDSHLTSRARVSRNRHLPESRPARGRCGAVTIGPLPTEP